MSHIKFNDFVFEFERCDTCKNRNFLKILSNNDQFPPTSQITRHYKWLFASGCVDPDLAELVKMIFEEEICDFIVDGEEANNLWGRLCRMGDQYCDDGIFFNKQ